MHRVSRLAGCLALCALAFGSSAPHAGAQRDRELNTIPDHDAITAYFASVRADLYTCPRGWHGELDVELTFSRDGRATNVEVDSDGALPEEVRSCVASVLRAARIRAFSDPVAIVEYTFRL